MDRQLQEKVLIKIGQNRKLTEGEEEVVSVLERKGLVKVSEDEITLTSYGKVITIMGYDSVKRAEEMEEYLSKSSSEVYERNSKILLIMFGIILFVLLLIFWAYFEDLFYLRSG